MKQMTMKQTREALAFLSIVDMMHVEGLAAGTINENAARIEYKAQGGRPVRYIRISSRARKANLDAIAAAVAEAIGAGRWAEIVAVVTGEQIEETEETEETTAPAEEQTTETEEEEEEETMFNNYTEAVTADAVEYIRDNYTAEEIAEAMTDRDEFAEQLNDEMWIADEVTGNASGSYTFDRMKAREYVLHDIAAVRLALREFATPADTIAEKFLAEDWEYFDVTARCYVLGQAIDAALDIIEAETKAA